MDGLHYPVARDTTQDPRSGNMKTETPWWDTLQEEKAIWAQVLGSECQHRRTLK